MADTGLGSRADGREDEGPGHLGPDIMVEAVDQCVCDMCWQEVIREEGLAQRGRLGKSFVQRPEGQRGRGASGGAGEKPTGADASRLQRSSGEWESTSVDRQEGS